jgi:hypothetical protein
MSMPKASVDEDRDLSTWENDVWAAWQILAVQPKAKSLPVKRATEQHFRLGVSTPDRGHHP